MKKIFVTLFAAFLFSFLAITGASAADIPGDVNGDGKVNVRDSATLLLYLQEKPVACRNLAINANGDSVIDEADAELILKFIACHEVELALLDGCEHILVHTEALPATYKTEGNIEYWSCSSCLKLFADASAEVLVTRAYVTLPVIEHTHTVATEPGTPATERGFGYTDRVWCTTCSEVFAEKTLLLPLGIENPDYYAGSYSYYHLGTLENGAGMQAFYEALDAEMREFHTDYTVTSDENGYLDPISFSDYGISRDEAMTVYLLYRDDHPLYYWSANSVACSSRDLYPIVSEEYRDGAVRKSYNEMVYEKAAEYLMHAMNETSEYQIAFALHDAITLDAFYAYKPGTNTPEDAEWAHSIIGIFESNSGVCESYTEVFSLLLNFLEIENIRVTGLGNGGGHAWNLVRLDDGNWYWYDLTWNDNSWPMYGVIHRHFAVTDTEETAPDIPGWSFGKETFLDDHEPGTNSEYGLDYNVVLPERADAPFSTDDTMIHETFERDSHTYTVIGYDTLYCSSYYGFGTPPPETIEYRGRKYEVVYYEY